MPTPLRDLDILWDTATGEISFATGTASRTAGNYVKREETLKMSLTIEADGASGTIPANTILTILPVNDYDPTHVIAQWTGFVQVGDTNVYTATATINGAYVTTLLGLVSDTHNCVFDLAGDGVNESDSLAIVLKNNQTRSDAQAPTTLLTRSDFLVTNGTGLLVNVGIGILPSGAQVAAQTGIAITNATNYVQLNSSGVASVNTSGFTDGYSPLAVVVASAGAITSNSDRRPWIDTKGAASSTLTKATTATSGFGTGAIITNSAGVLGEIVPGAGFATAAAIAVGTAGSILVNGGALGTPASGNFGSGTFTWPTFNQNTSGNAATATNVALSGITGLGTGTPAALAIAPNAAGGFLTIIATGKQLWTDSVNGSDANAGTFSAPILTLAAAKTAAASGDTVCVRPGTYAVTDSILKNGVNWWFEAGATVTMTQNALAVGILDDKGAAVTCNVTGAGTFALTSSATGLPNFGVVNVTHASSIVNLEALDITLTHSGTPALAMEAVNIAAGKLALRARNISATGTDSVYAFWWSNGSVRGQAQYVYGKSSAFYCDVNTAATGDAEFTAEEWANGDSTEGVVYGHGTDTSGAAWLEGKIFRSASLICIETNAGSGNKIYVTAQKLYGSLKIAAGKLYVLGHPKMEATANTTDALFVESPTSSTGVAYLYLGELDPSSFTGPPFSMLGGSASIRIFGAQFTGIAGTTTIPSSGIGSTAVLLMKGCSLDFSAAAIDGITATRGTVNVENCRFTTNAANKDIAQSVAGTVNVSGGWGTGSNGNFTTSGTVNFEWPSATFPGSITGNAATVTTNANLTGPVTSTGNATAIANGAISNAMLANGAVANLSGTNSGNDATNSQYSGLVSNATHTGDATGATALTLATVNSNVGTFGSATQSVTWTVSGKGLVTAAANVTITPAITNVSGLGTSVATALQVAVGSAGAFVVNGGALGTPSNGVVTNLTGTASININGTVGATTPTTGAFTNVTVSGALSAPSSLILVANSGNIGLSATTFCQFGPKLLVGTQAAPTAYVESQNPGGEHFRGRYDASNYFSLSCSSAGLLTIDGAGGSKGVSIAGTLTVAGQLNNSTLAASKPVFTDGSKNLTTGEFSVPQIVASGNPVGQTGANASVANYTTPSDSTVHSFRVGGYANITAISAGTLTVQVSFTDETGTAQTLNYFGMGLTSAGLTATGFTGFSASYIRCNPNTAITFKTTFTGVSITYDVGGTMESLY